MNDYATVNDLKNAFARVESKIKNMGDVYNLNNAEGQASVKYAVDALQKLEALCEAILAQRDLDSAQRCLADATARFNLAQTCLREATDAE